MVAATTIIVAVYRMYQRETKRQLRQHHQQRKIESMWQTFSFNSIKCIATGCVLFGRDRVCKVFECMCVYRMLQNEQLYTGLMFIVLA